MWKGWFGVGEEEISRARTLLGFKGHGQTRLKRLMLRTVWHSSDIRSPTLTHIQIPRLTGSPDSHTSHAPARIRRFPHTPPAEIQRFHSPCH